MKRYIYSGIGLVALAVLFLAFNVINSQLFSGVQADLTDNGRYTLSDGTKKVLSEIDEPIHLYFYYSEDVAQGSPQIRSYARDVRDLLQQYVMHSHGKLVLKEINPEPFSEQEDQAAAHGLQGVALNDQGDKLYFGLAGSNAIGQTQSIAFFHPDRQALLEYDISKMIYKLEHPQKPKIGVISSLPIGGAYNKAQGASPPWVVYRQADELFDLQDLKLPLDSIGKDIDVLWIVQPSRLDQKTRYAIDQYLMRGGHAMIFVDPMSTASQLGGGSPMARMQKMKSDMPQLFKAWGLTLDDENIVVDPADALTIQNSDGQRIQNPALIGINGNGINGKDVITSQLSEVNMGYAGHLTWKAPKGVTITPLLQSSPQAKLLAADNIRIKPDPASFMAGASGKAGVQTLAVRISGKLPSAFPDGPPKGVDGKGFLKQGEKPANVVVAADADMLQNNFWAQTQQFMHRMMVRPFAGNGDLLTNGLDNLAGNSALIGIRSRAVYSRPFKRVQAIKQAAQQRFQAKEQELEHQLHVTERKLTQLKTSQNGATVVLSADQRQALQKFQADKIRIRKELRHVRHQLNQDIETLGTWLKVINIAVVPLVVALFGLLVAFLRYRRRKEAWEAHRE